MRFQFGQIDDDVCIGYGLGEIDCFQPLPITEDLDESTLFEIDELDPRAFAHGAVPRDSKAIFIGRRDVIAHRDRGTGFLKKIQHGLNKDWMGDDRSLRRRRR